MTIVFKKLLRFIPQLQLQLTHTHLNLNPPISKTDVDMFAQRRQVPQKAGPADLRVSATPAGAVRRPLREIPRKPVPQVSSHVRRELPREMQFVDPSWASNDFVPRAMAKAPAQAPNLRDNRSKEPGQFKALLTSVYQRGKKGKSRVDKTAISAPIELLSAPPSVPTHQAPRPTPRRPHAAPAKKPLPPLPSEWKTSNPVFQSSATQEAPDEEARGQSHWSAGVWSVLADDGDQEPHVADWSSDEEGDDYDLDAEYEDDDDMRRASTEVVVNGESVMNWRLPQYDAYMSFPEPSFETEEADLESEKQRRRRGMVFSSSESFQLYDPSCAAGEGYEEEDDNLEVYTSSEENSVVESSSVSLEPEYSPRDEDSSSPSNPQQIEIVITPPTPTRGRSGSLVSSEHLTVSDAYKRIAEKSRREANRAREESELVLHYCKPLMKAFDLIKSDPDFAHLGSWEGAFEVLEMILKERKYNRIDMEQARGSATWFKGMYEKMLDNQIRRNSIQKPCTVTGNAHDVRFMGQPTNSSTEQQVRTERRQTRHGVNRYLTV